MPPEALPLSAVLDWPPVSVSGAPGEAVSLQPVAQSAKANTDATRAGAERGSFRLIGK
jgi:hypothetical protein